MGIQRRSSSDLGRKQDMTGDGDTTEEDEEQQPDSAAAKSVKRVQVQKYSRALLPGAITRDSSNGNLLNDDLMHANDKFSEEPFSCVQCQISGSKCDRQTPCVVCTFKQCRCFYLSSKDTFQGPPAKDGNLEVKDGNTRCEENRNMYIACLLHPHCRNNSVTTLLQEKNRFGRGVISSVAIFNSGRAKGMGVEATENIVRDEVIMEYVGEVLSEQAFVKRGLGELDQPARRESLYKYKNAPGYWLNGRIENIGRYVNHCPHNPNCRFDEWIVGGRVRVILSAGQDIHKGEELTVKYADKVEFSVQCCLSNEHGSRAQSRDRNRQEGPASPERIAGEVTRNWATVNMPPTRQGSISSLSPLMEENEMRDKNDGIELHLRPHPATRRLKPRRTQTRMFTLVPYYNLIKNLYLDKSKPIKVVTRQIYEEMHKLEAFSPGGNEYSHMSSIKTYLHNSGLTSLREMVGDWKMEQLHHVRDRIKAALYGDNQATNDKIYNQIKQYISNDITISDLQTFLNYSKLRENIPKKNPYSKLLAQYAPEIKKRVLNLEGALSILKWLQEKHFFPEQIQRTHLQRFIYNWLDIHLDKEFKTYNAYFQLITNLRENSVEEILQELKKQSLVSEDEESNSLENFMIRMKIIPYSWDGMNMIESNDEDSDNDEYENGGEEGGEDTIRMGRDSRARHQKTSTSTDAGCFPNHVEIVKLAQNPLFCFHKIYHSVPIGLLPKDKDKRSKFLGSYTRQYGLKELRHLAYEKLKMDLALYESIIRKRWEETEATSVLRLKEVFKELNLPNHLTPNHLKKYVVISKICKGAAVPEMEDEDVQGRTFNLAIQHGQISTVYQKFADQHDAEACCKSTFIALCDVLPMKMTVDVFRAYLWASGLERPPFENIGTITQRYKAMEDKCPRTCLLNERERGLYASLVNNKILPTIGFLTFRYWIRYLGVKQRSVLWRLSLLHDEFKQLFVEAIKENIEIYELSEQRDIPSQALETYAKNHGFEELRKATLEDLKKSFAPYHAMMRAFHKSGKNVKPSLPQSLQKHLKLYTSYVGVPSLENSAMVVKELGEDNLQLPASMESDPIYIDDKEESEAKSTAEQAVSKETQHRLKDARMRYLCVMKEYKAIEEADHLEREADRLEEELRTRKRKRVSSGNSMLFNF